MNDVLWRRLGYMLSPQLDLYKGLAPHLMDKEVLEIGFGTGFGTLQYACAAELVTAIETDESAVKFATENLPLANVAWLKSDILKLWMPQRFDAVVMVEVLEHIQDWSTALENAYAYLKPSGVFYMTARNANADLRRNDLHEREVTAKDLMYMLMQYFESVRLFDYRLKEELGTDTHVTPLIAVARKQA